MKCICIACRKELENILGQKGLQPLDGTAFWSSGHYGSTVFDPMDCSKLEIVVCDECLLKAAADQGVSKRRIVTHHQTTVEQWNPDAEEKWETIEDESALAGLPRS